MRATITLRASGQPAVTICSFTDRVMVSVIYDLWDILHRTGIEGCVEVACETKTYRFWAHEPYDLAANDAVEASVVDRG
jgi:hypothetical protein